MAESTLVVKIDGKQAESQAKRLERALKGMGDAGEKSTRKLSGIQKTFAALKVGSMAAGAALAGVTAAFTTLAAAGVAVGRAADSVAQFRGQLRNVSAGTEEATSKFRNLVDIANETGTSLSATVSLYTRMARATQELGVSSERLQAITGTINKAFALSGTSSQEAANSLLQLSQGMAAGALRGEELNSVMENAPILARAIADSMGIAYGELRQVASEGQITTEVIVKAMEDMRGKIDAEFANIPLTIGRASQMVRNNLQAAFTEVDISEASGSMKAFADQLKDPEFIEAMAQFAQLALDASTNFIKMASSVVNATMKVRDWFSMLVNGADLSNVQQVTEELQDIDRKLARWYQQDKERLRERRAVLLDALSSSSEATKIYADEVDRLVGMLPTAAQSMEPLIFRNEEFRVVTDEVTEATKKKIAALKKEQELYKKNRESVEQLISAMRVENAVADLSEVDREYLNILREKNINFTNAERDAIYELIRARQAERESMPVPAPVTVTEPGFGPNAGTMDMSDDGGLTEHQKHLKKMREENLKAIAETGAAWESLRPTTEMVFESFTRNFESMVRGVAMGTQSMKDAFKNMAQAMIADLVKLAAYKAILTMFGGPDTQWGGAWANVTGLGGSAAKGGVVEKFAKGGVLNGPMMFPLSQGTGLAGEAGPEAIVPLARTANGDLGVGASPINLTINNNAPGVEVTQEQGDGGVTINIDTIRNVVAGDISQGGNAIANSLASSFGLQRAGV